MSNNRFSPRNGEVILKLYAALAKQEVLSFSPRNGEVILKKVAQYITQQCTCFSPRNGEVILKRKLTIGSHSKRVSVPAMGK